MQKQNTKQQAPNRYLTSETIGILKLTQGNSFLLAGDSKKNIRQRLYSNLTGKPQTKKASGIKAIEEALEVLAEASGFEISKATCKRAKEKLLGAWTRGLTSPKNY